MPRINARIDEATETQLVYLTEVTGASVSHVVRDSVSRYYGRCPLRPATCSSVTSAPSSPPP